MRIADATPRRTSPTSDILLILTIPVRLKRRHLDARRAVVDRVGARRVLLGPHVRKCS
jgi:hypothetical protein